MKNKLFIAVLSAIVIGGANDAHAAVDVLNAEQLKDGRAIQEVAPLFNTPSGATGTDTYVGTGVIRTPEAIESVDTSANTVDSSGNSTVVPPVVTVDQSGIPDLASTENGSAAPTVDNATPMDPALIPDTNEAITVNRAGDTIDPLMSNIAKTVGVGLITGIAAGLGVPSSQVTYQANVSEVKANLTGPQALAVMNSGMVDEQQCANMIEREQVYVEQRTQGKVENYSRGAGTPATEAMSCTAASQAIMANAFMDIFRSRGMQNKIFSLIGKDATKFFRDIGMPEGLGMELISQIGNTLVKALGIDKAINDLANKAAGAIGGALGVSIGIGPSHIKVSTADCKMMEKLSKPPCALSEKSILKRKDADGTTKKCIDYAAMNTILGMATNAATGNKAGLWNSIGGLVSGGLDQINDNIDRAAAAKAATAANAANAAANTAAGMPTQGGPPGP